MESAKRIRARKYIDEKESITKYGPLFFGSTGFAFDVIDPEVIVDFRK
jgi:hypothetical protein